MNPAFWKGKRVLVTGNTGFKGSWLSYWLVRWGAKITGLALPPPTSPNLFEAARLNEVLESRVLDVRDAGRVAEAVRAVPFDVVLHLAAQPLVRASYDDPLETYAVNVMGTANLLQAVRGSDSIRVALCITTDKVYDNREWAWPYREIDALGGRDPYASSKACAELVTDAFRQSFFSYGGAPAIATARGGNVIGGGDWSADRIVPDLIRAFAGGMTGIVRNPNSVRPWQFVLDALNGYLLLAERMFAGPHPFSEAWNFGPDFSAEQRVAVVADRLAHAWGGSARWRHESDASVVHEAAQLKLDSSKARMRLGWRDFVPFDDAIDRSARWYAQYYGGICARRLMDDDLTDFERRMASA